MAQTITVQRNASSTVRRFMSQQAVKRNTAYAYGAEYEGTITVIVWVPETLAQEQQKSSTLRDEFDTHKASAAGNAQDIATLKSQVASLQSAVAPLPETKKDLES